MTAAETPPNVMQQLDERAGQYMTLIVRSMQQMQSGFDAMAAGTTREALALVMDLDNQQLIAMTGRLATWLGERIIEDAINELHAERADRRSQ